MSEDKRTATQRIEDLEKVVTMLYQATSQIKNATDNLLKSQQDVALLKEATKLLNKKVEAVVQVATPESGITVESVTNLVLKMNVEDLKQQVVGYIENGHLAPAEEVAANSYLVCEEYNADGTLANPRIQFRLDSQTPETTTSLTGKKVGDTVSFGENKFSAKILEIYSLVEPKAEAASAATETVTEASATAETAPETPAAETPAGYVPPAFAGPDTTPSEAPVATFVSDAGTVTPSETATA